MDFTFDFKVSTPLNFVLSILFTLSTPERIASVMSSIDSFGMFLFDALLCNAMEIEDATLSISVMFFLSNFI